MEQELALIKKLEALTLHHQELDATIECEKLEAGTFFID